MGPIHIQVPNMKNLPSTMSLQLLTLYFNGYLKCITREKVVRTRLLFYYAINKQMANKYITLEVFYWRKAYLVSISHKITLQHSDRILVSGHKI